MSAAILETSIWFGAVMPNCDDRFYYQKKFPANVPERVRSSSHSEGCVTKRRDQATADKLLEETAWLIPSCDFYQRVEESIIFRSATD